MDYENEVEPILQVLVGKSIEHARIELSRSGKRSNLTGIRENGCNLKRPN